jgi:hypothetical protein
MLRQSAPNPWRDDDAAFRDAALALLNLKESHRGFSPEEFLSRLQPDELDQFAEAFAHRFHRWSAHFSTFPVAGESADVCVMREINDKFGASLLKIHSSSMECNTQTYDQYHYDESPAQQQTMIDDNAPDANEVWRLDQGSMIQYRQNQVDFQRESYDALPLQQSTRHQMPTTPIRQFRNESSVKANDDFKVGLKSILRQRGQSPENIESRKKKKKGKPEMEVVGISTETLTPSSRQVDTLPTEQFKALLSRNPASDRVAQAKTVKQESATRQSLMSEIERVSQILDATKDESIQIACKGHLSRLKLELRLITHGRSSNNHSEYPLGSTKKESVLPSTDYTAVTGSHNQLRLPTPQVRKSEDLLGEKSVAKRSNIPKTNTNVLESKTDSGTQIVASRRRQSKEAPKKFQEDESRDDVSSGSYVRMMDSVERANSESVDKERDQPSAIPVELSQKMTHNAPIAATKKVCTY